MGRLAPVETAELVVAITFGAVMGWGMGWRQPERLPIVVALLAGIAGGLAVLVFDLGDDPGFVGGSLVAGCGVALAAFTPRLLRTRA